MSEATTLDPIRDSHHEKMLSLADAYLLRAITASDILGGHTVADILARADQRERTRRNRYRKSLVRGGYMTRKDRLPFGVGVPRVHAKQAEFLTWARRP